MRCVCVQQGIACAVPVCFSFRVYILNRLRVSAKQRSGEFHVLTGWCSNRSNEGCSGPEGAGTLLVCLSAGPFVGCRVLSPVGASNQTAGKQAFHFLDDLFHTSWKAWLGLLCFLPALCHLWLSEGSSGRIVFTLTLCAGQSQHPVNLASNLLSYTLCFPFSKCSFLLSLPEKKPHFNNVCLRSF